MSLYYMICSIYIPYGLFGAVYMNQSKVADTSKVVVVVVGLLTCL